MTIKIKQCIEQTDAAVYNVTMTVGGDESTVYTYERSNPVFPVYHTLISELQKIEDCAVHVTTNSEPLVREYNDIPNPNATHLRNLKNVAARQGVTLTITAAE